MPGLDKTDRHTDRSRQDPGATVLCSPLHRSFNEGWRFARGDYADAPSPQFDDRRWRTLSVPHDWSIEGAYDRSAGDGATGYLKGGVGWYRHRFATAPDTHVYFEFDGVYNHADVWINGVHVRYHPYGYSPVLVDATDRITSGVNTIAVRVDRTREVDSRWYTGSGIYRGVRIHAVGDLHIPLWSAAVTTEVRRDGSAAVTYRYGLRNAGPTDRRVYCRLRVRDGSRRLVWEDHAELHIGRRSQRCERWSFVIASPQLWSVEDAHLYTSELTIEDPEERLLDTHTVRFGIRTIHFDPENGFFLNGAPVKIKGVCLHHEAGLVGAAVPKDVWRRRLASLKAMGCNAIRSAHNPASTDLLDLCDEMGLLVQEEFFDEWDYPKDKRLNMHERHTDYRSRGYAENFRACAESDLKDTVRCHRNHPSIFQWSIGNEIEWTYPRNVEATGLFEPDAEGSFFWRRPTRAPREIRDRLRALPTQEHDIARTAARLATWTREADPTRPITANCVFPSTAFESGLSAALDVVGCSYRRVMYDALHRAYPETPIMGCENVGQWHEWRAVIERNFVSGTFIWTGADYMGEAHSEGWPTKGRKTGFLDFAGFRAPSWYFFKALWTDEPCIYATTQTVERSVYCERDGTIVERQPEGWKTRLWGWHEVNEHWDYAAGETIIVEAYSNCRSAELFVNGASRGRRLLADREEATYVWVLTYERGEVCVVGYHEGGSVMHTLRSAGPAVRVHVEADRTAMVANRRDCAHICATLIDEQGTVVRTDDRRITFSVEGPARLLGVDNGSAANVSDHRIPTVVTNAGRALCIVQTTGRCGTVGVRAHGAHLTSTDTVIEIIHATEEP